MKKRILCSILLLVFLFLQASAFANAPITDDAGYLMQSELTELSEKLEAVRSKYGVDVVIYTEDSYSADSVEAAADDIYDYQGYGSGEKSDGILFYICSQTREYHFTTHGEGEVAFNANGLVYLESKVLPYLSEDDYYGACLAYIETADELLEMAAQGSPYNKKPLKTVLIILALCLILPLLIAFLKMHKKLKQMKTANANDEAANYVTDMKMTASRDLFLYSHVTKTERPKSESGSHTSSSGRSHGGRGGSF